MITLAFDLARSRRVLILSSCIALLLVSIGYLALYPSLEDQLATFADDLPDAYRALLGDVDIASAEGYVRSQVYSLIAPLITAGAAISAGASLARSERDHTLGVLAVLPLSCWRLVGSWWLLIGIVSFFSALATVVGVTIGAPLAGAEVSVGRVLVATLPVFLFASLVGSIALLIAAVTGAPATATGAGWLAVFVGFVLHSAAELVDAVHWLAHVSPWSWHGAGEAITTDFDFRSFWLLFASTAVVGAAAVARFGRRNLHL